MKKFLFIALFLGASYGLFRFCHKQTAGFAVSKIQSTMLPDKRWEIDPLSEEEGSSLRTILAQPYSYLGKGAQCYVFASQDGQYVIKFFRVSHLEAPFWLTKAPLPALLEKWRGQKIAKKVAKRDKDFTSYKLAYQNLRPETGLIYLHLNKSGHLKQKITLIDKIGIAHQLELDQLEFIVQKRATPFYSALTEMIVHHEIERAKGALSQLIDLFAKRRQAGLFDKDPDLQSNFGFISGHPIQFDIGRFQTENKKDEPFKEELIRITDKLRKWLEAQEPFLAGYLEEKINREN